MRVPPKAVIHLNFLPEVLLFEPRRIWTALTRGEANGRISGKAWQQVLQDLGQTAICLAQRDYILRTALQELKRSFVSLKDRIPDPWSIPEIDADGMRYRVVGGKDLFKDRDKSLLAVDSLLFEFRAYLELLAKLVYGVLKGIGRAPTKEKLTSGKLITIIDKKGRLRPHDFLLYLCNRLSLETSWYQFLSEHRNFFTHEAAPYLAIEDRLVRPPEFEFIVMRVNIRDFAHADPGDYFRLSEFTQVVDGVKRLCQKTQDYIVDVLER